MPSDPRFAQSQLVLPDPTDVNALAIQQQFRNLQPWGLKVTQTLHSQTFVNGTTQQLGFDTLNYNNYQSLTRQKYSLAFNPATLGGNLYPYAGITVPQTGIYRIRAVGNLLIASTVTQIVQLICYIYINGSVVSFEDVVNPLLNLTDNTYFQCQDDLFLNAGDIVTIFLLISESTLAANGISGNTPRLNLRYLGPS